MRRSIPFVQGAHIGRGPGEQMCRLSRCPINIPGSHHSIFHGVQRSDKKRYLCMFKTFQRGHVLQLPRCSTSVMVENHEGKTVEIFPLDFQQCTEKSSSSSSSSSSKSKSSSRKLKRERAKKPPPPKKKIVKPVTTTPIKQPANKIEKQPGKATRKAAAPASDRGKRSSSQASCPSAAAQSPKGCAAAASPVQAAAT